MCSVNLELMLGDVGVRVCARGATLSSFLAAAIWLTGRSLCSMLHSVLCENADGGQGEKLDPM